MKGKKQAIFLPILLIISLCMAGGLAVCAQETAGKTGVSAQEASEGERGALNGIQEAFGEMPAGDLPEDVFDDDNPDPEVYPDVTLCDVEQDAAAGAKIKVTEVKEGIEYSIRLTGLEKEYTAVRFRVWSETGGEDDVRTYKAEKQASGSYTYRVKLADHKHIGVFRVVAYGYDDNKDREEITDARFETPVPKDGIVSVTSVNYDKGTFKVRLTGMQYAGYAKKVRFSVWSKADKSNLKTYDAAAGKSGTYTAAVDISNHAYRAGTYQIKAFAVDNKGDIRVQSTAEQVLAAELEAAGVSVKTGSRITITNLKYPGGFKAVSVKAWSVKKGKDDVRWYTAPKKDGLYRATVRLAAHRHLGEFKGQVYVTAKNGKKRYAGQIPFVITEPYGGTPSVASVKVNKGTFSARLSDLRYRSRVKKVRALVWSRDSQSDKKWYTAVKRDGVYRAAVSLKNHKNHCGTYHVQFYTTDIKGGSGFQGETSAEMVSSVREVTAAAPANAPEKRTLKAAAVQAPAGVKKVRFSVWSEDGGKDDLTRYNGRKSGSNYVATVNVRDHKSAGIYHISTYVWSKNGTKKLTNEMTFDAPADVTGMVKFSNYSKVTGGHTGKFKVKSELETEQKVVDMHYTVWFKEDRSDQHIYKAVNAENAFEITADVKNHKYHFGDFTAQAYGFMENGAYFEFPARSRTLNPYYYIYSKLNKTQDQAVVTMKHNTSSGIDSVEFPSWSLEDGQDDIVWYSGTQDGNNWSTTVYGISHKSAGKFQTDVYTNGSTEEAVATTTYRLKWSTGFAGRRQGIDVSKWNGVIDWKKVKGDGIKYAIIRCGFGSNLKSQDDVKFAYNVAQCEKLGIPYGVYIYSHATTTQEAYSEAQHCIRLIKGHYPKYPVYLDLEDPADTAPLSNKRLALITETWAKKIEAAGYKAGVYSSTSWWKTKLTKPVFDKYEKWVAQWAPRVTYTGKFSMWQYSSEGKVKGISGNVDMNYAF